jgi:hypothetical protein
VLTTDLQHTPTFVSESLTFVEEFSEFYDQQVSDFAAIQFSSPAFGLPFDEKEKKFVDEAQTKLSNAERKADLLELKATPYFHDTKWLPLFEEVHTIWGSAERTSNTWFEELKKGSNPSEVQDLILPLERQRDELGQAAYHLQGLFIDKLKQLPAENSFFKTLPKPTPLKIN